MSLDAALRAALAGRTEVMLEKIARLVEVNSFTENMDGGARVAELLRDELATIPGISSKLVASDRFAPHLFAWSDAAKDGARVAPPRSSEHHDTDFSSRHLRRLSSRRGSRARAGGARHEGRPGDGDRGAPRARDRRRAREDSDPLCDRQRRRGRLARRPGSSGARARRRGLRARPRSRPSRRGSDHHPAQGHRQRQGGRDRRRRPRRSRPP